MVGNFNLGGVFIFSLFLLLFHISNTMSSQEKLQLTEEAVMMCSLSGVHSEVALLLWANRHNQLLHPLVETRLSEIRSIQMTPVDKSIMYHAESFNKESETVASDFLDADEEELYHAQSQEQQGPTLPASTNFVTSSR